MKPLLDHLKPSLKPFCSSHQHKVTDYREVDSETEVYQGLVVEDVGKIDGIRRVLFSFTPLQHWSTTLLLTDVVHHFLRESSLLDYGMQTFCTQLEPVCIIYQVTPFLCTTDIGLTRYVHIDIDDVFVAKRGTRMVTEDVEVRFIHSLHR